MQFCLFHYGFIKTIKRLQLLLSEMQMPSFKPYGEDTRLLLAHCNFAGRNRDVWIKSGNYIIYCRVVFFLIFFLKTSCI